MMTAVKTATEIAAMRESGRMLATVLNLLASKLDTGMSTKDLANYAKQELKSLGGQPAFLGYQGFPDVLCVSLNDEVVHGIPSPQRIIRDGDIVGLDFGVTYHGMITDAAISLIAGNNPHPKDVSLVRDTKQALLAGIEAVHGGVQTGDIAAAVYSVLEKNKYGVVRDLVGHGVGHDLHEEPNVPNYGRERTGERLEAGMTIAIEPMATLGDYRVFIDRDGWTVRTRDGSRSAHFEHTILITENGAEILTSI